MPALPAIAMVGGSLIGGALSSNASNNATRAQTAASDAAVAEQRRQFDQMMRLLMPSYDRSNYAANIYMQALGIPMQGGASGGGQGGTPLPGNPTPQYPNGQPPQTAGGGFLSDWTSVGNGGDLRYTPGAQGGGDAALFSPTMTGQPLVNGGPNQTGGQTPTMTQQGIYDMVRQTPGYQAQLQQGMDAIDRAAPLRGGMYSGRRMQALNDYGQNTFGSYYNDWMNRVGGLAGQAPQIGGQIGQMGMNMAGNIGNLMINRGNAQAQGALNSASAWNGAIGQGLGMVGASQGWF